ncbi:phospholipase D-like domain-containing protein [Ralstonia solanacearum species complex bacterium KE056]|uniref:phospholipase D-like domain-containing protein n=1 Tax=Ralstonia solanacearum species complex bacterium KE056 TaxID=3119585 RepID=UPI002FC39498
MKDDRSVQLLLNAADQDHSQVIVKLMKHCTRLECLVAFAKASAHESMVKNLRTALARGLQARIAVGLSFHLTEPQLLRTLWKLSQDHSLELFLSKSKQTFHPKIYSFWAEEHSTVIVGSANLTRGGLSLNHEASALIPDPHGNLVASVTQHFDELLEKKHIEPAKESRIDEYEREFNIHEAVRKAAKASAEEDCDSPEPSLTALAMRLHRMKADPSENGFDGQMKTRGINRRKARALLEAMASAPGKQKDFSDRYEELIASFHSGGLHRSKTRVAQHARAFTVAIADIVRQRKLPPSQAFNVLHRHFGAIPGAGINIITEILHALDNERFAVMNQNAVAGMKGTGLADYPTHPTKTNVEGDTYERYCQHANIIQQALGLANLTELDNIFNFDYWKRKAR